MSRASGRTERLRILEKKYLHGAYTDEEMAELVDVASRATIYKDRMLLMDQGIPFVELERGRWKIDRQKYISSLRINLYENAMLYLMARKAARQTRSPNPHVVSLLESLAVTLNQPLMDRLLHSTDFIPGAAEGKNEPTAVLEKIIACWIEQRKIRIRYQGLRSQNPTVHLVSPYLLEPSLWDESIYLVGYSETMEKIVPFKVNRIQNAADTTQSIIFPQAFNESDFLQNVWSIWDGDGELVTVTLRFRGETAVRRVRESVWHPNQSEPELLPNGDLIWSTQVAEWREMLPWVRGWGADVEVLAPEGLVEQMKEHAALLAKNYGIVTSEKDNSNRLLRLWGKTTQNTEFFHPALFHMLDVAHVAQQLLSPRATPRWRQVLAHTLGADADSLHEWLPWIIALHDIGKISVPFQAQNETQKQRLQSENFDFGRYTPRHKKLHHTLVGRHAIKEWVKRFPLRWRTVVCDMVSGHHGEYQQLEREHKSLWATLQEPEEWSQLRQQAIELLRNCLLLNEPIAWPNPENISAAIVALNGFTILCDWLGSDETYFTPRPFTSLLDYLSHSRRQAHMRVTDAGFFAPVTSNVPTPFADLFGWQPRPLQQAIDDIPRHLLVAPTFTIIEAPTGEGKTEAALTLAHRIAQTRGTDELYVALPTTATSNAMYTRLQEHLQLSLSLPADLVKLIHGQDFLVEDDLRIAPLENGADEIVHPALDWFAPKKRALLAPFGVGTVDQAELSALNVRHNALRLIGLAGKTVILDEVHAYDTYMTTIIERMLRWLAEMGTSVILLSATLPTARRRDLIAAYTGNDTVASEPSDEYPYLLTVNAAEHHAASPPPEQDTKTIHLRTLHFDEEDWTGKAKWLVEHVADGGCICWITNTVERAQRIFQQVKALASDDVDCMIFHARFPLADRQNIEKEILQKFGKGENGRPRKSIVIGTQVLEQSLDIDFDLMVSDLAPIDLILQRIGRLHRHQRPGRVASFPEPTIYINCALDANGQLVIGADRFYTPYILHKTWRQIAHKADTEGQIILPRDYRSLVEAVYDEEPPAEDSDLFAAWQKRQQQESKLEDEAKTRLAGNPDARRPFWQTSKRVFHEDEDSNDWIVAQTRYQERQSLTVIPLEKVDAETGRLIPTADTISLDLPADCDTQLRLLQRCVRLSHPTIVQALLGDIDRRPTLFTGSALLKRCHPLWLVNGTIKIENLHVQLDPELGVLIQKEGA